MLTLIAILMAGFIVTATTWSLRSPSTSAESLRRRLPTLYGASAGLSSLLLPWIRFSLLYDVMSPPLLEALSTALEALAELLDLIPLGIVSWLFQRMVSLPGYMLFIAVPNLHPLVLSAVAISTLASLLNLVTGLIAFLAAGRRAGRIAGGLQLLVSIVSLGLLLAAMPCLDQWGTTGNFKTSILAVSLGAGLDFGAWVAAAAFVLMAAGAVLTLLEPAHRPVTIDYGYRRKHSGRRRPSLWR